MPPPGVRPVRVHVSESTNESKPPHSRLFAPDLGMTDGFPVEPTGMIKLVRLTTLNDTIGREDAVKPLHGIDMLSFGLASIEKELGQPFSSVSCFSSGQCGDEMHNRQPIIVSSKPQRGGGPANHQLQSPYQLGPANTLPNDWY